VPVLVFLLLVLGLPAVTLRSELAAPSRVLPEKAQPGRATLKIVQLRPFTVRGRSFKPGERVRVSTNRLRKVVVAGPRGGFTVTFPDPRRCNGLAVTAVGSKGSRASISSPALDKIYCVAP
jgi:hypothetical protein